MSDHLYDAGEIIAKAVKASVDPHAGWITYVPAGQAATRALIEAGWTPPGDGDETARLRQTVLDEQSLARQAWEHLARKEAELDAADAFRMKFLGIWMGLRDGFAQRTAAARSAHEPEPTYTAEQIIKWLDNMLDRSDKAADRTKTKVLAAKQAEKLQAPADVPAGLFEAAS
jgi:hypothetical protein